MDEFLATIEIRVTAKAKNEIEAKVLIAKWLSTADWSTVEQQGMHFVCVTNETKARTCL